MKTDAAAPAAYSTSEPFRARLETLRTRLLEEIGLEGQEAVALATACADEFVSSQHPADVGTELYLEQQAWVASSILRKELELAERALARLDQGVYEQCQECGELIGAERLEARPQAVRCIKCERGIEASGGRSLRAALV